MSILPDTGAGGFTNFNRFYFSQLNKQGAVIDERFNGGGQVADYIIEAMQRKTVGYWAYRYGAIETTTTASIPGPKVMIINEVAGSGGDAMPWLFPSGEGRDSGWKAHLGWAGRHRRDSCADGWWHRDLTELRLLLAGG